MINYTKEEHEKHIINTLNKVQKILDEPHIPIIPTKFDKMIMELAKKAKETNAK